MEIELPRHVKRRMQVYKLGFQRLFNVERRGSSLYNRNFEIPEHKIRLPSAATFKLPPRKRGWGVLRQTYTPLYPPLFRGESQKIEIPVHEHIE